MSLRRRKLFIIFSLAGLFLAVFFICVRLLFAQTSEPDWSVPINLSNSGATHSPQMVKTPDGDVHIIWQDEAANQFMYVTRSGEIWGEPVPVELPFGTRVYSPDLDEDDQTPLFTPHLVSDSNGRIHAFWQDEEDAVFYSQVEAENFTDFALWTPRQLVAEEAIKIAPVVDGNDQIHIAYIRSASTEALPAGVYHRQNSGEISGGETDEGSATQSASWTAPILLYESSYYRSNPETSLQLAASELNDQSNLYVVWDDQSLDKVFFSRSLDNGATWEETTIVDLRLETDDPSSVGPSNIQIFANDENLLLMWEAGHDDPLCTLYYQTSNDGGSTWQPAKSLLPEQGEACPQQRHFSGVNGSYLILMLNYSGRSYLIAWDGTQWSNLGEQPQLDSFRDNVTNRRIIFHWQQSMILNDGLVVLGQDPEQNSDVWLLGGSLGNIAGWFPAPSAWSSPEPLTISESNVANLIMDSGRDGIIHAIWTQNDVENSLQSGIYYAQWNGEQWTLPLLVLETPNGDQTNQPYMIVSGEDRVLVVWVSEKGDLFFSQAEAANADFPSEWSEPIMLLSTANKAVSSPVLLEDEFGRFLLFYAQTLNEDRGIYLIYSEDNGGTWTEPAQVFNAAEAGWEMINNPHIALTDDGKLHAIWTRYSLPPEANPIGLYYAASNDHGETWSEPTTIVETAVNWSRIVGFGERVLHRVWQESGEEGLTYQHDFSADDGVTFKSAERISGLEDIVAPPSLTLDRSGQLHLILADKTRLEHTIWNGSNWEESEGVPLTDEVDTERETAASAISTDDELLALYSGVVPDLATGELSAALVNTYRLIDLSDTEPTPLPTLTPTPEPSATATAIPEPTPTPTISFETAENGASTGETPLDNDLLRIVLGVIPVLLLVVLVFGIGTRTIWQRRR